MVETIDDQCPKPAYCDVANAVNIKELRIRLSHDGDYRERPERQGQNCISQNLARDLIT